MVAGEIDFPAYMKTYHENVMGDGNLTSDITQVINTAFNNNPFETMSPHDPSVEMSEIVSAVSEYYTLVSTLDYVQDWKGIVDQSGYNAAGVNAYDQMLTDQLEANTLTKFDAQMRNIGAVMTSAFAIGQQMIYAFKNREVAKYAADLSREGVKQMIEMYGVKIEAMKSWMGAKIESKRMELVAQKEEQDAVNTISEAEAKWDLELFQYAGNVLSSISGAPSISKGQSQASSARSTLGGALSGAALGAGVGGNIGEGYAGWGALAGSAAGAAMSYL